MYIIISELYHLVVLESIMLFQNRYHMAKMSVQDRATKVAAVVESMERDLELLCLTGVEDKLQDGVRPTLELLRNAGIKVCKIIQSRKLSGILDAIVIIIMVCSH